MIFYILLDLNFKNWKQIDDNPFDCLRVFINAVIHSSHENILKIVNNMNIIYDSEKNDNIETILEYQKRNINEDLRINVRDLGYCIMQKPNNILIWTFDIEDENEYMLYAKCLFSAQKHNCIINGYSFYKNQCIRMCCVGSGGIYFNECNYKNIFKLLGNIQKRNEVFMTTCFCCKKHVKVGFVCPICLSIYCKFLPVCKICKTKFSFKING